MFIITNRYYATRISKEIVFFYEKYKELKIKLSIIYGSFVKLF